MARVISESSQMVDYFDEERERLERKKLKALSKEDLPLSLFQEGLHCLGRTFNNARHAYLSLTLSNKN